MDEDREYLFVGVDVHKHSSTATILDGSGHRLVTKKLQNSEEAFTTLFKPFDDYYFQAVLEAGRNWGVVYDLLENMTNVAKVTLANPFKVKAIADAKLKTDTVDSITLANLLRTDYIPEVYVPPKDIRTKKYLIRHRCFLVVLKTRVKNRIHIILERNHILIPPFTDIFGLQGRRFMETLTLPSEENFLLQSHLQLLDYLVREIKRVGGAIQDAINNRPDVTLLKSVPGIGPIFAPLIALEIHDINRFCNPKKLWSYAGLVPSTYASGERFYHGALVKYANKWLRWAFVEAAHASIKSSVYFGTCYNQKKLTKGTQAAMITTARRLAKVVYYVLKEKRTYREFEPRLSSVGTSRKGSGQE